MNVGKCLKLALIHRNKSQQWLADELGVSKQHVSRLIRRRSIQINTIRKISTILDYSWYEFLKLDEDLGDKS